jgi:proton-dependent oligopeptide transporter, POT family
MPLVGGWIADSYLGRFATIQWSILFAIVGHALLICASIPSVMDNPSGALGLFGVGLVIMGIGTGGFKSNISNFIAEQIPQTRPEVITLDSGERVIKDPQVTISRVFLYFYMMINLGSLSGGIGMVYAERYIGFWLSYALPTFMFFAAPLVLFVSIRACENYKTNADIMEQTGLQEMVHLDAAYRLSTLQVVYTAQARKQGQLVS